jgi:hypothetical protein
LAKKKPAKQATPPRGGTKRDAPRARTRAEPPAAVAARGRKAAEELLAAAAATEARILEVLANPAAYTLATSQKIELAGVSRTTWFRVLATPGFKARAARAVRDAVGDELGPVLDSLVKSAKAVGRDGHYDRKLYLELMGEVRGDGRGWRRGGPEEEEDNPQKGGGTMTDAEILDAFEGRQHLLPPGVQRRLGRDPDAATDHAGAVTHAK